MDTRSFNQKMHLYCLTCILHTATVNFNREDRSVTLDESPSFLAISICNRLMDSLLNGRKVFAEEKLQIVNSINERIKDIRTNRSARISGMSEFFTRVWSDIDYMLIGLMEYANKSEDPLSSEGIIKMREHLIMSMLYQEEERYWQERTWDRVVLLPEKK